MTPLRASSRPTMQTWYCNSVVELHYCQSNSNANVLVLTLSICHLTCQVAFVTKDAIKSRKILEAYGWRVLERGLPVELSEIENKDYATRMKDSGCCGADEFLKLWAYTLTEYHRVGKNVWFLTT